MQHRRGKAIAWGSAAVGFLVLLAGAVLFRDRLAEEWYLRKLESGDEEGRKVAAEKLAEMGSARSVRTILKLLETTGRDQDLHLWVGLGGDSPTPALQAAEDVRLSELLGDSRAERMIWLFIYSDAAYLVNALWRITTREPRTSAPYLAEALSDDDWYARLVGSLFLGKIGADAREAVPAVTEVLQESLADRGRQYEVIPQDRLRPSWISTTGLGTARGEAFQLIWVLGQIGPGARQAVPVLTALLEDQDEAVRQAATEALTRIQGR